MPTKTRNKQKLYYAISKGSKTGIWKNWLECQKYCIGVKSSCYRGFIEHEQAVTYLKEAGIKNIANHFSDDDDFFDESLDYTLSQNSSKILVNPKAAQPSNPAMQSTPNQKGPHPSPLDHSTPNHSNTNGKQKITFNPLVKSFADATQTQTNHDTIMNILGDIKQELVTQRQKLEDLTRDQASMDQRLNVIHTCMKNENIARSQGVQEIKTQNQLLTTGQCQLKRNITTITDQNAIMQHRFDAIDFVLDKNTETVKPKKKSPLLPTPKPEQKPQLDKSFKAPQLHPVTQPTHLSIPPRQSQQTNNRDPQFHQTNNKPTQLGLHQVEGENYHPQPDQIKGRHSQSKTTHSQATEIFNPAHKVIHSDCTKLIIGDSVCQSLYPSKRDSLAVRTLYNSSLHQLADSISQLPTNTVVKDICLLAGSDVIANLGTTQCPVNIDNLISEYHHVVRALHNIFPNAYISTCSLLPNLAKHLIPSALHFCEGIRRVSLCYRFTRYIDILTSLITPTNHQNYLLFTEENFLNKRGSYLLRNKFLDHIDLWKSET